MRTQPVRDFGLSERDRTTYARIEDKIYSSRARRARCGCDKDYVVKSCDP